MEQTRFAVVPQLVDPTRLPYPSANVAGGSAPVDADQRISMSIHQYLDRMCESAGAGELFDVEVRTISGAVRICGATNSESLYQQLIGLVPVMQASIAGVDGIDFSRLILDRGVGRCRVARVSW